MNHSVRCGSPAFGVPLMKFTLTYDGELPASGNSSRKPEKKWEIRKQISPQLDELWHSHPALLRAMSMRVMPKKAQVYLQEEHHFNPVIYKEQGLRPDEFDLCASIEVKNPKTAKAVNFRPLVRRNHALACSLKILFMRREPVGSVYNRGDGGGGDLDNRVKTLLDALSVPAIEQVMDWDEKHLYCLLEDDALVTGLSIETSRLLARPGHSESEVRLVVDVDVRITDARAYNTFFLGD